MNNLNYNYIWNEKNVISSLSESENSHASRRLLHKYSDVNSKPF